MHHYFYVTDEKEQWLTVNSVNWVSGAEVVCEQPSADDSSSDVWEWQVSVVLIVVVTGTRDELCDSVVLLLAPSCHFV